MRDFRDQSDQIASRPRGRAARGAILGVCIALSMIGTAHAASPTAADKADAILRRAMKDRQIPGLQAAVIVRGKVVFSRSYGVANLQTPVRVTARTIFTVNSITKAFTGIAVMREVEKGRLDLSAPISRYLDDIPPDWGRVTVRQLMGQISGLPDMSDFGDSKLTGVTNEKEAWAWALKQPVSPPGKEERYCQTNLALVQRIINKLNGRAPDTSIIDEELKDAGTLETAFGDSQDVIKDKSQPYRFLNSEGLLRNHFEQFGPMMRAGSGLNSTANDMARWMNSVLSGRQITDASRTILWTPVPMNDGKPSSFAIGWGVDQRHYYWTAGMSGGGRSAFSLYPAHQTGVVILTNLLGANPEDLTDEVAAAFVPEIKLSGVLELRARAERTNFADFAALLGAAAARKAKNEFDEGELGDWIRGLLWSGNLQRALQLALLDRTLFPSSRDALEFLGKSYFANGEPDKARDAYTELQSRDPNNADAMEFLKRK